MSARLDLLLPLLRHEGWRSVCRRLNDRHREWWRGRSFRGVAEGDEATLRTPVLHLLATPPWGRLGGVQLDVRRRIATSDIPFALAYPLPGSPETLRCEWTSAERHHVWSVTSSPTPGSPPLVAAVRHLVNRVEARLLHVENPHGFDLDGLSELAARGPTVLSVHDFSLFCRRPHLLDSQVLEFCDYCRDDRRCARCLGTRGDPGQASHRRRAADLLGRVGRVVFPSEFLLRAHVRLFPDLDPGQCRVLPPGLPTQPVASPIGVRRPRLDHRVPIALLGGLKPHKGSRVVAELLQLVAARGPGDWAFEALGSGDPEEYRRLADLPSLRIHGFYQPGSLPTQLCVLGCRAAVIPSIVPETYCLALDECVAAGVPVVAFDLGALAERIPNLGAGRVVPRTDGAAGLRKALGELLEADGAPLHAPAEPGRYAEVYAEAVDG